MTPEGWVVLGIGIATVLSQLWTARIAGGVAEKQLAASQAALRSELASVLVLSAGGFDTSVGNVHAANAGRHAAIDLRLECLDDSGQPIASGRTPVVGPTAARDVKIVLGSVDVRDAFGRCSEVSAEWSEGLGPRKERLPLLPPG